MKPVMLWVFFRAMIGENKSINFLFNDADSAHTVHDGVIAAADAYNKRMNDREKIFTFTTANGPASVDVSEVMAVTLDDPAGMGKEATDAWNALMAVGGGELEAMKLAAKAKALNDAGIVE